MPCFIWMLFNAEKGLWSRNVLWLFYNEKIMTGKIILPKMTLFFFFWLNCKALITISPDATGRTLDFTCQTNSLFVRVHSHCTRSSSWSFSIFCKNHYVYWDWAEINEWKWGRVNCFRSMSQSFCGMSILREETLVHQAFSLRDQKREMDFCL